MLQFLKDVFRLRRGSRLYPGIRSAQFVNGTKVSGIDIDDPEFNQRVRELLLRVELEALGHGSYEKFTIDLTPAEDELYAKDCPKFEMITQLQIMHSGLSLVIAPVMAIPGPPTRLTFFRANHT